MTEETKNNSFIDKLNAMETERFITIVIASCVAILFLMLTTCTIHMNTFNAGEEKIEAMKIVQQAKAKTAEILAEAEVGKQAIQGKIDLAKQKHTAEMERLKVVERLIKVQHIDPIAARCAVEGWSESDKPIVCQTVATGKTLTEEKQ